MGKTKLATIDDSIIEESKDLKVAKESKKIETSDAAALEAEVTNKAENVNDASTLRTSEVSAKKKEKKSKATVKKGKAKYRSVKYKEAAQKVEKSKRYPVTEAIDLSKQTSYSKFDGSLEIHIATNAKNIRGLVSLPFASGKKLKILAFGPPSLKASEGQAPLGEDVEIGDDNKLNEIIRGITNFDVLVTTADWMPKLARAAKVLGPRGLMPSPKNGTITNDLKKAVSEIQSGKVEYKTEKGGQVIHLNIGKVSQETDQIMQNMKILFNAIGKTRIKKAVISPSMGMGVKVDLQTIY